MKKVHLIAVVITVASTTTAFNTFVQSNKETILSWSADVKAGTHSPEPYASQFYLSGNIHIQPKNNSLLVKISNVTHRVYNGIVKDLHDDEMKNLPEEVHDLERVFKIVYYNDGTVEHIVTPNEEKEFSRNIKKAIASIFQLNNTIVGGNHQRPESFVVKENNIYRHGKEVYTVFPQSEKEIEVHKLHNFADLEDISSFSVTNTEAAYCDVKGTGKTVMTDSLKKYTLVKENSNFLIEKVTSLGSVVYHPFKAKSEAYMIVVNQTFRVKEVVAIEKEYIIENEHSEKSLSYRPFLELQDELIRDETNGRHSSNYTKLYSLVQDLLKDVSMYLNEDHITSEEPDTHRGQLINRIREILRSFSVNKLQELQKTVPDENLNVYYNILPLVGTEASTLYIKNLIVKKAVDDELSINLLQQLAENIRPSAFLVQKLETFIHLDLTYSWSVRKVAILTFGNIIQKSYLHHINFNDLTDPQEPFVKYVDEYITKLRNSHSYHIQVTYLLGLRNMMLPVLAQRLTPAFDGTWWSNPHLRYMAIWAAAPPIIFFGPDKIIETFWPIFTNRNELRELRAFSYYYIMYSRPSLSLLRSIFTYMLTEPDEELYQLHYTLSQTLVQSTDFCHQDMKNRLAQVMKFTPPPRRGSSMIGFFGYQDLEFGFSAGIQQYYLKGNKFRIYAVYSTLQRFDKYEEEYAVYWKIQDGRTTDPGLVQSIMDIISDTNLVNKLEFLIEASIAKRGKIINTFSFDKTNIHELLQFVNQFTKPDLSLSKNFFYVTFRRYHSSIIPTDLGIPAYWEYLMPEVHSNELSVSKDASFNIKFKNNYRNWVHYRHGLSFYNPISDVWQGVSRYHSFDAALPLNFDLSLNLKAKTLQVDWGKHNQTQLNVFGLRSHVKQMVFIKGIDEESNEEVQIVGEEKQFRGEHFLFEANNQDTGYKISSSIFDSEIDVSYLKNRLFRFPDPSSKYFKSPLEHLLGVWQNFIHSTVLLPSAGTYGILFRAEPSEIFSVTSNTLFLRLQYHFSEKALHHDGLDWKAHVVYSAKQQEKIVRSWDVSFSFGLTPGHTYGSFDMKLARITPEETDYKVCFHGAKTWKNREVLGSLSAKFGRTEDDCSKEAEIELEMIGQRSLEQRRRKSQCQNGAFYLVPNDNNLQCFLKHSTLRNFTYAVKMKNIPPILRAAFVNSWDSMRSYFSSSYTNKFEGNNITDNLFKINILYPLNSNKVKVDILTPTQTYEFSGLPAEYWEWFGLQPDSTTYPLSVLRKYEDDQIDRCVITIDNLWLNKKMTLDHVSEEWVLYVGEQLNRNGVYLKVIDKKIAVKIVSNDNSIQMVPSSGGSSYQILFDGTVETETEYQHDWIHYRVLHGDVVAFLPKILVHLVYNPDCVVLVVLQDTSMRGRCYGQNMIEKAQEVVTGSRLREIKSKLQI